MLLELEDELLLDLLRDPQALKVQVRGGVVVWKSVLLSVRAPVRAPGLPCLSVRGPYGEYV